MHLQDTFNTLDSLYESLLELDTPYMLRTDGKIFSCKELLIHPYINTIPTSARNIQAAYKFLLDNGELDNYKWFIEYSLNDEVKSGLQELLAGKIDYNTLDSKLTKLKYLTNQEFCRVRTSGKYLGNPGNREIYFRISSFNFNWFDIIWQLVLDNKRLIKHITICTDEKAKGYDEIYKYRGIPSNHLSIEDFLNLPGNPVIEELEDADKATTIIREALELSSEVYEEK